MKAIGRYAVLCVLFEHGELYQIRQQFLACNCRKTLVSRAWSCLVSAIDRDRPRSLFDNSTARIVLGI